MRTTGTICRYCSSLLKSHTPGSASTSTRPSTRTKTTTTSTKDGASTKLRQVMRRVAQPVAIITIPLDPSRPHLDTHGATLSSLSSVSLSPPIVGFSLRLPSRLATYLLDGSDPGGRAAIASNTSGREGKKFKIHLLSNQQEGLARLFARQGLIPPTPSSESSTISDFDQSSFDQLEATNLGRLDCQIVKSIPLHSLLEGNEIGVRGDCKLRDERAIKSSEGQENSSTESIEATTEAPRSILFLAKVSNVEVGTLGTGEGEGEEGRSLVYKGQSYHVV